MPSLSIEKYQNKYPWKKFGKIVALTDEELTGVKDLNDNLYFNDRGNVIYDLDGRRVNDNGSAWQKKGLYIVNGRKVLVK